MSTRRTGAEPSDNIHRDEALQCLSHELRMPLNAIIGFAEVLLARTFGELNAKQEDYLAGILQSGSHLLAVINDILDLSRLEAGKARLVLEGFPLPELLHHVVDMVRGQAGQKGISLDLVIVPSVDMINADALKVKQILLNLLSNAIKFTSEGGSVCIRARRRGKQVAISVSDTGIGIPAEECERVFEEFYRVDALQERGCEGSGLGLALVKRLVELHGGSVRVESEVGKGSTFTFAIPLKPPAQVAE